MTKAQIQVLIDTIDTTGSSGTTGQELKTIYEALKNELWDYKEVQITSSQIRNIDVFPVNFLNEEIGIGKYPEFEMILEYTHVTTPYNAINISVYNGGQPGGGLPHGAIIDKTFISESKNQIVQISSKDFVQIRALDNATTNSVIVPQTPTGTISLLSTNVDWAGNTGNGTILAKIWYKIHDLGSEL